MHIVVVALITSCRSTSPLVMPLHSEGVSDETFNGCGCIGVRCDLRHLGVDLDAPVGTPVFAVGTGEAIHRAGPDQADGWGDGNYALFIRHDAADGRLFVAVYGHIRTALAVGSVIEGGAEIGRVGQYQETTDDGLTHVYTPHLHFGIHPGATMPIGPTGLALDHLCDAGDSHGWVAPIAFIGGSGSP